MKIPFQNVRAIVAKLVGNPNVSEGAFAELDSAITADEASVEALLSVTDNPNQTADLEADGNNGSEATIVPLAVVVPAMVAEVVAPMAVADVVAPVVVASIASEDPMAQVLARLQKLEADKLATDATNARLATENAELRANASPRSVVPVSENDGGKAQRLSRLDQKDADRVANIERLIDKFPDIMKEFK
jgi:hypothetical protein